MDDGVQKRTAEKGLLIRKRTICRRSHDADGQRAWTLTLFAGSLKVHDPTGLNSILTSLTGLFLVPFKLPFVRLFLTTGNVGHVEIPYRMRRADLSLEVMTGESSILS